MKYARTVSAGEGHGVHPWQPLPVAPGRAPAARVEGRETGSAGSSADPHLTCQGARRIPPRAPRKQPRADTPSCRAAQAGRSRACLNILRSIYNSRNKPKPRRLCACHLQPRLHFFLCADPIQPLKPPCWLEIWGHLGIFSHQLQGRNTRFAHFRLVLFPALVPIAFCCSQEGKNGVIKLKNLLKIAHRQKAIGQSQDAPIWALIMAPINCRSLMELEWAPWE